MLQDPPTLPRFDHDAQERIAGLFRRTPPQDVIALLESYAQPDRESRTAFEKYYGWALYEAGDYCASRLHLTRALRATRAPTADRALVRGLLGESYLRTSHLDRAERCAQRALAQIPADDPGNYLRAGHLCLLGRVYRRQGHLTHAIETYRRGLSLVDDDCAHFTPLVANLVLALLYRANVHEAGTLVRDYWDVRRGGASQAWCVATVDSGVALELGDVDRAERVLDDALASSADLGERIVLVLRNHRAAACRARGEWRRAESLERSILEQSTPGGRNGDMVACAARGLAESLAGQGRHEEALEPARVAARAGRFEDRAEWAAGLRVLGGSLAALGRRDEARRVFQEARGLHERTEFELERRHLDADLVRLGFGDLARRAHTFSSDRAPAGIAEVRRTPLEDGRTFLTLDAGLLDDIRTAATGDLPALIEGETGTGKEIVAHLLHELGPRAGGPFVVVDCTTLPADLADVELFGAARGAYTGAHRDRPGLIAQADRGTIFFDELPELSHALQAKLLRLIQEGPYRRVGEDRPRRVLLRFVAATNRSIEELLRDGGLKPDLYYRLNGFRLTLRPLRTRREEIAPLAGEIVRRCGLAGIQPDAVAALEDCAWPGNVRQLEMVLRVAAGHQPPGSLLELATLEPQLATTDLLRSQEGSLRSGRIAGERAALARALAESGGIVSHAARLLGLSRQAFYKAMRRTGLTADPATAPRGRSTAG